MAAELTPIERSALTVTHRIGSPASIVVHTVLFIASFALPVFGLVSFDRMLLVLTTILSLEAIYLALFIQMTVNIQGESIMKVEKDIDEIQEDVEDIQEDVEEIQEDVDELQEDVEDISEDVEEMSEEDKEEERIEQEDKRTLVEIQTDLKKLMHDIEHLQQNHQPHPHGHQ